jgi:RNA polymerase sigma-70 factor (ECF subfamily)
VSSAPSNPVTMLLHQAAEGDSGAVRTLLPLIYDELRALAAARLALQPSGHTLQATALVHEAYLKLVSGTKGDDIGFASRAQFFAAAARSMRNILVDHARAKLAVKRGGDQKRVELDEAALGLETNPGEILALHELLTDLEREDARKASIVSMKFFGGMTGEEIAAVLGTSGRTVEREWRFARAWMQRRWGEGGEQGRTGEEEKGG